ncbi:MAG: S41 family peptidase [Clostridia bacterium]|nr:S41 family peptidase [Clostridia bacterium]
MEEEKKIKIDKEKIINYTIIATLTLVISTVIIYCLVTVLKPVLEGENTVSSAGNSDYIKRIEEALSKIEKNYIDIDDVSMDELIDGAISGLANAAGDPYTHYVTEEEYNEMLTSGTEKYGGLGIHLTYDKETGGILIVGVMPNTPAYEAGIKAGDIIAKVGDKMVSLENYKECVDNMKGTVGESVHLTMLRGEEVIEKDIKRALITANNVESKVIEDNIGYIKILSFENNISEQFKTEYDKLMKNNISGLVIDIRNNPGGFVSETIKILDLLLPKGDVLKLVYKDGSQKVYKCSNDNQINIPLAIVANSRSASASEILAGAVKDSGKGAIIGNKTYGKGIVQEIQKLSVRGALSITVAKYYTASGIEIHKNGIEPNISVDLPKEVENETVIPLEKDTQIQKAIEYIHSKK